jgi:hypothetical protein
MADYQPGTCNIGKTGQRKRYILGASGLISGLLLAAANFFTAVSDLVFVGVAALLFIGFEGLFQGYESFCVAHASKGTYNVSDEKDKEKEVEDEKSHLKDMEKAKKIHIKSLAAAALTTIMLYILQLPTLA